MHWDSFRTSLGSWDWGTVPEWFAAVGTIGAVLLALLVARRDGKRYDREVEEARQDRQAAAADRERAAEDSARLRQEQEERSLQRKREFAQSVTLRIEWESLEELQRDPAEPPVQVFHCDISVENHGLTPVYDVILAYPRDTRIETGRQTSATIRASAKAPDHLFVTLPLLAPGANFEHSVIVEGDLAYDLLHSETTLVFKDVRGQYWKTDHRGRLEEVEGDDSSGAPA